MNIKEYLDSLTPQELEAELARQAVNEIRMFRQNEYPPITDYLDAVVKGGQAQIDKYIADCLAVKAKYPKPSST